MGGSNITLFEYTAAPGKYIVTMYAQAVSTESGRYDFYLFIDNATANAAQFTLPTNHAYPSESATGIINLTSTSTIKMVFWGTSNVTLNARAMRVLKLGSN